MIFLFLKAINHFLFEKSFLIYYTHSKLKGAMYEKAKNYFTVIRFFSI